MSKHQKNIVTANPQDASRLQEHITEALKMPSNTPRFIGTITHGPDHAGTTIFVTSGGRQFLAFVDPKNPVKLGDSVTFRISGLRAIDFELEPTPEPSRTEVHEVPTELPQSSSDSEPEQRWLSHF